MNSARRSQPSPPGASKSRERVTCRISCSVTLSTAELVVLNTIKLTGGFAS